MALPAFDVPVCRVCGGAAHAPFAHCFCCATLVRQLEMPLTPVVAMVDYRVGDRIHRRLRGYKDAPVAEVRQACAAALVTMVRSWMAVHREALESRFGGPWEVVATVPSSTRPDGAPVDALVARVPDLAARHRPLLMRGPEPTGHLLATRRGFELTPAADRAWLGEAHPRLRRQHHHRSAVAERGGGPAGQRGPRRRHRGRGPGGGRWPGGRRPGVGAVGGASLPALG